MVALNENAWAFRGEDGLDRSHVPPIPLWVGFLRVAQLVIALLVLILAGVSAGGFGTGDLTGLDLVWFSFAWTLIYLGWLFGSVVFQPVAYHYWAHLPVEFLTTVWWLSTFAVLASEASSLNIFEQDIDELNAESDGEVDGLFKGTKTAIDSLKGAAGIGALEWVLFVVSLVFLVLSVLSHRKTEAAAAPPAAATAQEVQEVPVQQPVVQQPVYQQAPPPQEAYQQPPEAQAYQVQPTHEPAAAPPV